MAGDILLYQTDLVPIGDDQRQHLELTRDVAQRFNFRFGETFRLPEGVYPTVGGRIMDLQEPTSKMSTSTSSEQGAVYVIDSPDAIRKKFKTAVTDSGREVRYDPERKPGVSNLLEIMGVATGRSISEIEAEFEGKGYGDFKTAVGESVVELLTPIREHYEALRADERELQRLLAVGAEKARRVADPTLEAMYDRMGFARSEAGRFFGAARPRGL
jgi:tryptophanyl-tRNA synthetase